MEAADTLGMLAFRSLMPGVGAVGWSWIENVETWGAGLVPRPQTEILHSGAPSRDFKIYK
jgi:hypothetical protein